MKLVALLKRIRCSFSESWTTVQTVWALVAYAALSLITGRLSPKVNLEEAAKDSLIVCPSPLLNRQTINWEYRSKYVISFLNSGCLSATFLSLKPKRYFLMDPAYFQAPEDVPGLVVEHDDQTVSRIADVTDWPLTVFVPWHYRNSPAARRLTANPNITLCGVPVFNVCGRNSALLRFGFRLGLLNPIYQNVLIAAVFYSLKAGHRRVLLWGAHHTWLKEVEVDSENRVLYAVRHTDYQRKGTPLVNADGSPRSYHVYLQQLSIIFAQYHVLEDFARSEGKAIINATEDSFIDAFRRTAGVDLFSSGQDAAAGSE